GQRAIAAGINARVLREVSVQVAMAYARRASAKGNSTKTYAQTRRVRLNTVSTKRNADPASVPSIMLEVPHRLISTQTRRFENGMVYPMHEYSGFIAPLGLFRLHQQLHG